MLKSLSMLKLIGIVFGLLGFIIPFWITLPGLSYAGHLALSIFLLAAIFWMTEPVPIYATSLLVIFLGVLLLSGQGPIYNAAVAEFSEIELDAQNRIVIPASSISPNGYMYVFHQNKWSKLSVKVLETGAEFSIIETESAFTDRLIATDYHHKLAGYTPGKSADYMQTLANPIIILFLGGFMIAQAAVKYNFDKNITGFLLRPFGGSPMWILMGLMLITSFLSAFMSNTATTAMMMTVILPIMAQCGKKDQFRTALALSVPIAANIGGIATPIGTPPNAIVLANLHTQGISISFTDWMLLATPFVLMVLFFSWWLLRWMFPPEIQSIKTSNAAGFNTSPKAIVFYAIFAATLVLWVTESIHGISSNIVALLPVTALALTKVLDVEDIRKLPWEVLWLVAGGLALGLYLDQTGLADYMVRAIDWTSISGFAIIAMFGAVAWLLSNFLSNTVAATLLMPLAISIGILQGSGELELIELALIIGVGTSLAMLLPISTPPNAIAVATGMVKTSDMVKSGAVIGVIGIIFMLVMAVIYWPLIIN
jgi:solute carrier family 13 (sodium-dependent dicarboxylate transporter), member 2/3/5